MFKKKEHSLSREDFQETEIKFFRAIENGHNEYVKKKMKDGDFVTYLREEDKISLAFVQVILLNNVQLVKIMLGHGVDIHTTDSMFGENGIMHAVRYGHIEMVSCLLSCGLNANHQSENGSTALHIAVENSNHHSLQLLVQHEGVDLNIQDNQGYSPLLWAARLRDWAAMKILIDAGCNIESRDYHSAVNSLHIVVDRERVFWKGEVATAEDINKCIDLCLGAGLDINKGDVYGNNALVYAVRSDYLPAVKLLLKRDCFIEGRHPNSTITTSFYFHHNYLSSDDHFLLPLYLAMSRGNVRCVQVLCAVGLKYHKLAQEPNILSYIETNYPALYPVLNKLMSETTPLKQLCRNVIRSTLSNNIMVKVKQLDLPNILVNYICLSDIDAM